MIEPFYLQSCQAEKEEGEDQLVENRTDVNQPYGEMLKFVKSMPKGSKACVPKIRKIINGVQGGRFSKGECHDGKVEGEKGEGKHSCNHLVFCYRTGKNSD